MVPREPGAHFWSNETAYASVLVEVRIDQLTLV